MQLVLVTIPLLEYDFHHRNTDFTRKCDFYNMIIMQSSTLMLKEDNSVPHHNIWSSLIAPVTREFTP